MGKYAHIKKDKDMPGGLCGSGPATRGLIGVLADMLTWHADWHANRPGGRTAGFLF